MNQRTYLRSYSWYFVIYFRSILVSVALRHHQASVHCSKQQKEENSLEYQESNQGRWVWSENNIHCAMLHQLCLPRKVPPYS